MISPWVVYWVMQLDTFRFVLGVGGIVAAALGLIFVLEQSAKARNSRARAARYEAKVKDPASSYSAGDNAGYAAESRQEQADAEIVVRKAKPALYIGVAAAVLAVALPSSQTAAAMILVPKLTSPEVMQPVGKEAADLYRLAKRALAKLGDEDKAKESE